MKPSQKNLNFILSCVVVICASLVVALGIKEGRIRMARAKASLISAVKYTPTVVQHRPASQTASVGSGIEETYIDNIDNAIGGQFIMPGGNGFGSSENTGSDTSGTSRGFGRGNRTVTSIGATAVDDPSGTYLEAVEESGRASRFNLQQGDIVMSINGQAVTGAESFDEIMNNVSQGAAVSMQVLRDGKEVTVGRDTVTSVTGRMGRGG